jgi:alpha/beta superfamily hydrolase
MVLAPAVIVANSDMEGEEKYQKATDAIYRSFVQNDFSTLRFNFRKNKNVSRELDADNVNLLDLIGALEWLHNKNIECKSFWFAGVDIGAFYGLQLVMRRPEIDNYMLFSPSIRKDELNFLVPCTSNGVLVRAGEDLRFLEEDCINLREKLITKTESKIKYFTIYNAERNFDGELDQLEKRVSEYIRERIDSGERTPYDSLNARRKKRKRKVHVPDEEKVVYVNPVKDLGFDDV